MSPLWTDAVRHLRNCSLYRVEWKWPATNVWYPIVHPKHHLESIALKLVQICEVRRRAICTVSKRNAKPRRLPFGIGLALGIEMHV